MAKHLFQKGQPRPPGAGRKPGTPNRKKALRDELLRRGFKASEIVDPHTFMYGVMTANMKLIGMEPPKPVRLTINSKLTPDEKKQLKAKEREVDKLYEQLAIPADLRFAAAKELAQYERPKLKAVEHSQSSNKPLTPAVIMVGDEDQIKKWEKQLSQEDGTASD